MSKKEFQYSKEHVFFNLCNKQRGFSLVVIVGVVASLIVIYLLTSNGVLVPGVGPQDSLVSFSPEDTYLKFKSDERGIVTAEDLNRVKSRYLVSDIKVVADKLNKNKLPAQLLQDFWANPYSNLMGSEIKSVKVLDSFKIPTAGGEDAHITNGVHMEIFTTHAGSDSSIYVTMVQEGGLWKVLFEDTRSIPDPWSDFLPISAFRAR